MVCNRCGYEGEINGDTCPKCGSASADSQITGVTINLSPIDLEASAADDKDFSSPSGPALIVDKGPSVGAIYPLSKAEIIIGRHLGSDIFLDDITVSRKHARIITDDKEFILSDLGSLNGTYVNENLIEETRLKDGDEVQIGRFRFLFKAE